MGNPSSLSTNIVLATEVHSERSVEISATVKPHIVGFHWPSPPVGNFSVHCLRFDLSHFVAFGAQASGIKDAGPAHSPGRQTRLILEQVHCQLNKQKDTQNLEIS